MAGNGQFHSLRWVRHNMPPRTQPLPLPTPSITCVADLRHALAPERAALVEHPLYQQLTTIEDVRTFMEHHVFAVWDFMSLLKSLQREFTCVDVPWVPRGDPVARRLVNEIVLGEESDDGIGGGYTSHFELYRSAMAEILADVTPIDRLMLRISRGEAVPVALINAGIPEPARRFVLSTFSTIESRSVPRIAAAFTLGREDIIPDMFTRLVDDLSRSSGGRLSRLRDYLDRHI